MTPRRDHHSVARSSQQTRRARTEAFDGPDTADNATTAWPLCFAAAALVLGCALRIAGLGSPGLWVDEAYTMLVARLPLDQMFAQLRADEAPPLFYLVQRPFAASQHGGELMARIVPAIAGVLTLVLAWMVARRWSTRAATFAAWTFAASSMAVFYSRQARSYSMLHALVLVLLGAALRYRERPGTGSASVLVLSSAALLFTHNLAIWVVLAGAWIALGPFPALGSGLTSPGERMGLRLRLALAAALGVVTVLWLLPLIGQIAVHAELNAWMGSWWEGRTLAFGPLYSFAVFSNGGAVALRPPVPLPTLPGGWSGIHIAVWITVAASWITLLARLRPGAQTAPVTRAAILAVLLLAVLPLVGLLVTTWVTGPAYVLGRTDTLALPGFLLGTALGWSFWRPRTLAIGALALWSVTGCASWFPRDPGLEKGADRALAEQLGAAIQPGDAIFVAALGKPTLEYYAKHQGWWTRASVVRSFPPSADRNFAAVPPMPLDSVPVFLASALEMRAQLEQRGRGDAWILAPLSRAEIATSGAADAPWPRWPTPPPGTRRTLSANELGYPTNLIAYAFAGTEPVPVVWEYRQDGAGADRVALLIRRETWADPDSLPKIEVRP